MSETMTIWKFALEGLESNPNVEVDMPHGEILTVAMQDEVICVWAEVFLQSGEPQAFKKRRFAVHGTGDDVPLDGRRYVGTAHSRWTLGPLVLHLYELR